MAHAYLKGHDTHVEFLHIGVELGALGKREKHLCEEVQGILVDGACHKGELSVYGS